MGFTTKFIRKRKMVLVSFGYVMFMFFLATIATWMLWEYREVAETAIWMFLGIFSIMSIFFGLFFYVAFGRTAPDVQM